MDAPNSAEKKVWIKYDVRIEGQEMLFINTVQQVLKVKEYVYSQVWNWKSQDRLLARNRLKSKCDVHTKICNALSQKGLKRSIAKSRNSSHEINHTSPKKRFTSIWTIDERLNRMTPSVSSHLQLLQHLKETAFLTHRPLAILGRRLFALEHSFWLVRGYYPMSFLCWLYVVWCRPQVWVTIIIGMGIGEFWAQEGTYRPCYPAQIVRNGRYVFSNQKPWKVAVKFFQPACLRHLNILFWNFESTPLLTGRGETVISSLKKATTPCRCHGSHVECDYKNISNLVPPVCDPITLVQYSYLSWL